MPVSAEWVESEMKKDVEAAKDYETMLGHVKPIRVEEYTFQDFMLRRKNLEIEARDAFTKMKEEDGAFREHIAGMKKKVRKAYKKLKKEEEEELKKKVFHVWSKYE